jgi:serine/threonine kinase 16
MSSVVVLRRTRACLNWFCALILSSYRRWQRWRRRRILLSFDNVQSVEIGRLIAEGGFSYVYEAFCVSDADGDDKDNNDDAQDDYDNYSHVCGAKRKFVLKRINCADNRELVAACRREADAHRILCPPSRRRHPNLLELLGIKFVSDGGADYLGAEGGDALGGNTTCYMLFPYLSHSLRGLIAERNILVSSFDNYNDYKSNYCRGGDSKRKALSTREVLHLFGGILDGLIAIHHANLSHRDVKVENVMLRRHDRGRRCVERDPEAALDGTGECDGDALNFTPVLIDLGSSGPLTVSIKGCEATSSLLTSSERRRALLSIVEDAASHTTIAYRPPELFEGGMMTAMRTTEKIDEDDVLDYGKVDVW